MGRPQAAAHTDTTAEENSPEAVEPDPTGEPVTVRTAAGSAEHELGWAPLAQFAHRPGNARRGQEYDPAQDPDLAALRSTYAEFGVLQPVSVTALAAWLEHHPEHAEQFGPQVRWVVIMGNRRLAGACHHGLAGLPYLRNDRLAQGARAGESSVIENYHRKGTDPVREAAELLSILHDTGESRRSLAARIGVSHGQINQRLTLLELIPEFQGLLSDAALTVQKALPIARLDPARQRQLLEAGPPYRPEQLTEPAAAEPPGLATARAVTIKKHSSPAQVADTLQQTLSPELLQEVATLLQPPTD